MRNWQDSVFNRQFLSFLTVSSEAIESDGLPLSRIVQVYSSATGLVQVKAERPLEGERRLRSGF
jgi:hypothetical protein